MRYTVNCSILLTELPLPQRFQAVSQAGLSAVELWWPFTTPTPGDDEVNALTRSLKDAGVQLTGLNFDAGDMAGGDRGLVSWPEQRDRFRANVEAVTRIGELTGCKSFNALYGLRQAGHTPAEQDALGAENLAYAAEAVARIGGTILLEPVSGCPGYPLLTAADVVAVLDKVGASNIGLLFDVYHLATNGDDVAAALHTYADCIAHVQLADVPGRGAPGTGELPITAWLNDLAGFGYDGWVGLEYKCENGDPFAWLQHTP
ncbi:MAG: TIM barrel protein [Propionibacteriaceae bacterium]|jgi:hydroxypyruvate isomerase|nr:TIM barrel protein [Propionibacteriaceae bacterium]